MKMHEIAVHSIKQLKEMLETNREKIDKLVERMRNDNSDVCRELVDSGLLTPFQMCHAALRYELGKSREGKTVFWMIDEQYRVRDGMVGDTWASVLLKERGILDKGWCPLHCLFGLHLLVEGGGRRVEGDYSQPYKCTHADDSICTNPATQNISHSSLLTPPSSKEIAVVESVRSCVVLSERLPKYLWMATGYLANLNERLFLPLKGHHVVCFPTTDPTGDTYLLWLSVAAEARKYGIDITVSRILEDRATPSQKAAKIDLVDFLFPP